MLNLSLLKFLFKVCLYLGFLSFEKVCYLLFLLTFLLNWNNCTLNFSVFSFFFCFLSFWIFISGLSTINYISDNTEFLPKVLINLKINRIIWEQVVAINLFLLPDSMNSILCLDHHRRCPEEFCENDSIGCSQCYPNPGRSYRKNCNPDIAICLKGVDISVSPFEWNRAIDTNGRNLDFLHVVLNLIHDAEMVCIDYALFASVKKGLNE